MKNNQTKKLGASGERETSLGIAYPLPLAGCAALYYAIR